jgi:hypothetical protein
MKLTGGKFLRSRVSPAILLAGLVLFFSMFKRFDIDRLVPACPIKSVIGVDCPACGSSRCVLAIAKGDFVEAVDQNSLLVLTLAVVTFGLVMWVAKGEKFLKRVDFQQTLATLSVFTLVFWVIRILPLEIGNWLSSGTYHQ